MTESEDLIVSVGRGDKGVLTDANGVEVKGCIESNLTTGRCVVFELNGNGKKFVRHNTSKAAELVVFHQAPMRFEPLGNQPWGHEC